MVGILVLFLHCPVFTFVLDSDLPTMTTSSAILMQENYTFLPYSVEICHKICHFLSILAMIVAAF